MFLKSITDWFNDLGRKIARSTKALAKEVTRVFSKAEDQVLDFERDIRGDLVKAAVGTANVLGSDEYIDNVIGAGTDIIGAITDIAGGSYAGGVAGAIGTVFDGVDIIA